nr:cystinosin homolog [Tanacetum cinerariifolium]
MVIRILSGQIIGFAAMELENNFRLSNVTYAIVSSMSPINLLSSFMMCGDVDQCVTMSGLGVRKIKDEVVCTLARRLTEVAAMADVLRFTTLLRLMDGDKILAGSVQICCKNEVAANNEFAVRKESLLYMELKGFFQLRLHCQYKLILINQWQVFLHTFKPSVYKDTSHKPAVVLEVTDVEALCRFISSEARRSKERDQLLHDSRVIHNAAIVLVVKTPPLNFQQRSLMYKARHNVTPPVEVSNYQNEDVKQEKVSIFFDILFILQHYVIYPASKTVKSPSPDMKRQEPLVTSSEDA